jgi:hypothetical protein
MRFARRRGMALAAFLLFGKKKGKVEGLRSEEK